MAKLVTPAQETPNINLIGNGTNIKGDIITNGDIRIDGTVSGKIQTQGRLVVGNSGLIEGEIKARNADISGTVKGQMAITEHLSLKNSANIEGDIVTAKLEIEPGATFCGNCSMSTKKNSTSQPLVNEMKKESIS